MYNKSLSGFFITALLAVTPAAAHAVDLVVLSGGAVKSSVSPLIEPFHRETGHAVKIEFATAGAIQEKLKAGAKPDVIIVTSNIIAELEKNGTLLAGSAIALGSTGIGVAVREGAPMPDISSVDSFRRTLLAAKAVAFIDPARGGTSGKHFAGVLSRLGIEDAVMRKAVLVPSGYAAERVASGEADIVVHQISEIRPVKGVKLVGPLPSELQLITTYTAGIRSGSTNTEIANRWLQYMKGSAGRASFAAAGLDTPK